MKLSSLIDVVNHHLPEKRLNKEQLENYLNNLAKKRKLKRIKTIDSKLVTIVYKVNEQEAFEDSPPDFIRKCDPLPAIIKKDYIFNLFYHRINPFEFYPEKHHDLLMDYQAEVQEIIDEFNHYIEFTLYPDLQNNVKSNNEFLHKLLQERNSLYNASIEVDPDLQEEMDIMKDLQKRRLFKNELI